MMIDPYLVGGGVGWYDYCSIIMCFFLGGGAMELIISALSGEGHSNTVEISNRFSNSLKL